ncbi:hypothetical protein OAA99_02120, partial [Omnitrophica bacterium]|nr:hypothetical protein [Candidatus Omnitrophota bacterium]
MAEEKRKRRFNIQAWYLNNKGKWWFLIGACLIGMLIGAFVNSRFNLPDRPKMAITYYWIKTLPFKEVEVLDGSDSSKKLRIDYEKDKDIYGIGYDFVNNGKKGAENFEIYFHILNNSLKIIELPNNIESSYWKHRRIKWEDNERTFYRKLNTFPCNDKLSLKFILSAPFDKKDVETN